MNSYQIACAAHSNYNEVYVMVINYENGTFVDEHPTFIKNDLPTFAGDKSQSKYIEPSRPVEYEGAITKAKINQYFFTRKYPYRYCRPTDPDQLESNLYRFSIAIDAYLESSSPLMSLPEIIGYSYGPEKANLLKDIKRKSILDTFDSASLKHDPKLENIKSYKFKDIGDIFNYAYLPHWIEDGDDFDYMKIPVKQDKHILEQFRESVRFTISGIDFEEVEPIEQILKLSTSKCSIGGERSNSLPERLKKSNQKFSKYWETSRESLIQVGPANLRSAFLNHPRVTNTLSLIDANVRELLFQIKGSVERRSAESTNSNIKSFYKRNTHFFMRDLKKEGLTKPRNLLKIMLEVLNEEYPNVEAFKYTKIYDDLHYVDGNGEIVYPERGHGLGFANALTTLMQLSAFDLMKRNCDSEGIVLSEGEILAHNDDAVIGFKKEESIESYRDVEDDILEGLGLISNLKKSFLSKNHMVICERYYPEHLSKKESYSRREALIPYLSSNISEAKLSYSSCVYNCENMYIENYLEEHVKFWGYEFFPEEYRYPASCGGWVNNTIKGVRLDLLDLELLPFNIHVQKAFEASKIRDLKVRFKKSKNFISQPILEICNPDNIEDRFLGDFDLLPFNELQTKYTKSKFTRNWKSLVTGLYNKRQRAFKKRLDVLTYKEFVNIIVDEEVDFIYPDSSKKKKIHVNSIIGDIKRDVYISTNPKLDYILSVGNEAKNVRDTWSILNIRDSGCSGGVSAQDRKRLGRTLNSLNREYIIGALLKGIPILEEHNDYIKERIYRPNNYYTACSVINGFNSIDLIDIKPKEILIRKKEIFGRFLTAHEEANLCNVNRRNIKLYASLNEKQKTELNKYYLEEELTSKEEEILIKKNEKTIIKEKLFENEWDNPNWYEQYDFVTAIKKVFRETVYHLPFFSEIINEILILWNYRDIGQRGGIEVPENVPILTPLEINEIARQHGPLIYEGFKDYTGMDVDASSSDEENSEIEFDFFNECNDAPFG